ncbi:S1C family serine protease [Nafulsella turpanensis]|uniref:S1C family serine protease n=1 Tax=Nafulsella turpanensis TaxID=1265690 RepID=UPI0003601B89|nr:serine protease [Nafulsella turpanensis]
MNDHLKPTNHREKKQTSRNIEPIEEENASKHANSPTMIESAGKVQLSKLYEANRRGVFLVFSTNDGNSGSQGTGFFISGNGIAISNQHVFDGYSQHFVKLHNGSVFRVTEILQQSHRSELDYVIFKVDTEGQKVFPLKVASYIPTVGEDVFAIGNPKGLEHTLSKGIISAYREQKSLLQTTAEITNGSSGGPLFNMNGEVVGITTSGIGEANLNFVVNIQRLGLEEYIY